VTDQSCQNLETLTLTQIIRLQNRLSKILTQRFERQAALVASDIVGSTSYFTRFGDEAGHRLQQEHFDLLAQASESSAGHIVDTAGDGAILSFPTVEAVVDSLLRFKRLLSQLNCRLPQDHQWNTRMGVHWGAMLTDGKIVAGDSVNLCAKIAATANAGTIRLSRAAFSELPASIRLACHSLGMVALPSTSQSIELMELFWQELLMIPSTVHIEETGVSFPLPEQPVVTFGRLASVNGTRANDVILELSDSSLTHQISRWHFEILRESDNLVLHSLSDKRTEVDGKYLLKGDRAHITIGSQVRISGVLTLKFLSKVAPMSVTDTTVTQQSASQASSPHS
jgi:class 3 adenylate cyclase